MEGRYWLSLSLMGLAPHSKCTVKEMVGQLFCCCGAITNKDSLTANKGKVLHGIAQEPDLGVVLPEDDPEDEEEKDKPKVRWDITMKHGGGGGL
jgi:hypothetical protein